MSRRVTHRDGSVTTLYEYPEWLSLPDARHVCKCGQHSQTISTIWLQVEFAIPPRVPLRPLATLATHVHSQASKRGAPR